MRQTCASLMSNNDNVGASMENAVAISPNSVNSLVIKI